MSLVVLRSWSDGQPPKIKGIAPPDSDVKNEMVVPDHHGRFVTEEKPNILQNTNKVGAIRERFVKLNSMGPGGSLDYQQQNLKVGKYWNNTNRKSLPLCHSLSSSSTTTTPSPTNNSTATAGSKDLDKDMSIGNENKMRERPNKMSLSRESSLQSLQSNDPDSSPSSPVGGSSRYKNLGPELAATIPKRQIIRDTWVKDSYSIFRKKELSKSTPTLNLSLEEEDLLERAEYSSGEYQSERGRSSTLSSSGKISSSGGRPISPRPYSLYSSDIDDNKDKSWKDSVYSIEFEPKFGDKPASVVGVIKKDKNFESSSSSPKLEELKVQQILNESNLTNPEIKESFIEIRGSPPRTNNYFSTSTTSTSSPPECLNTTNTRSNSTSGSNSPEGNEISPHPINADLSRVKRIAKKAIRSVSFELDLHFNNNKNKKDDVEFPVHRAVHPSLNLLQAPPLEVKDLVGIDGNIQHSSEHGNETLSINNNKVIVPSSPGGINIEGSSEDVIIIGDEIDEDEDIESINEKIDLELDALRVESSTSGDGCSSTSGESDRGLFNEQQQQQKTIVNFTNQSDKNILKNNEEENMMNLNLRKTTFESTTSEEQQRRDTNRNSHGHGNKHGSAWAQVPVQCVNRHVIIPAKPPIVPSPVKPPSIETIITNGDNIENGKNNLRRKNFCDELLSNVILQVPLLPPLPPVEIMTIERPISPHTNNIQENHDGIIIFDEEDEFDESETDSVALSERENSFEYLSVFQNVKVGSISPTDIKCRPSPDPLHVIGLDLGSTYSRHCSLNTSTGAAKIGDTFRTLVTSDGLTQGINAIYHSMATKSKLIYKWRAKQTFLFDPYDDEDNSSILEILFKHYDQLLKRNFDSPGPGDVNINGESNNIPSVQWNVSVHSSMDKKLVREAAFSSGMVKSMDELRLVNESTAAAVMAYLLIKENLSSKKGGTTFLSVNIGSTYFHTSGYKYSGNEKLEMIENGDSQIFQSPESMFIELLSRVFSPEFLLKYESRFTPSWVELLIRFEEMKDNYIKYNSECYLFLPISFFLEFFKCTGIQVPECIEDNPEEGIVWDNNGAIRFTKNLIDEWLQSTLNFIKAKIKIKSYDAIVLSGGGTNENLRKELQRIVPSTIQIYMLDNPEKSVVQGLVNLDNIKLCLKSPFSIGVGVMTPFDESIHPEEKCVTRSGKKWCSDVWDNLIRKGQSMIMGDIVLKRTYVGAQPGQNVLVLPIFKSDLEEPKLVTSPYVEKCCELRFEINKEKSWREVQLIIKCCDRELSIIATGNDGDVSHVVIDF